MTYSVFKNMIEVKGLMDIQDKIYTLPVNQNPNLEGLLFRVQDFTLSHVALNTQFSSEYHIAEIEFPNTNSATELMSKISKHHKQMEVYNLGKNYFVSRESSPALRHFVNDSCRLIEPLTKLLSTKFPDVSLGKKQSLNSYINDLIRNKKVLNFDAYFIMELYEVWNGYKHRETKGTHATAWGYRNNKVIKPKLFLPKFDVDIRKIKNLDIDNFANQATKNIYELLTFTF